MLEPTNVSAEGSGAKAQKFAPAKISRYTVYFLVLLSSLLLQNVLDSYLSHSNSGVVLETVALFLHLTTNHPILERDVHHRIKGY